MSSFGGFGGFGSNNNQQSTGFGGFGSTNNNNTSGAFGSNNNTNTTFGSKPFGSSTTGGGLFGGGGSSSGGFGGFGSQNNNTTSAFGSTNNTTTGGGLFGQKSTGFGSTSTTTGGGLFGGGNTGGFGSTNTNTTTGGFGASTGGFGSAASQPNNGTASTPFQAVTEKDGASTNAQSQYQTITFQQPYQNYSLEELRLADYNQGRRYGNQNGQAGAFGQSTGFGGFGSNNTTTSTGFGANNNTAGSLFGGANTTNTTSSFGQNTGSAFGANNNASGGGLFGQNKPATGGLFGGTSNTNTGTSGGLFGGGSTNNNTSGGFGTGGGFGTSTSTTGGGLFGQNKPATGGLFGSTNTANTNSNPFGGSTTTNNTFGQSNTGGGGLFGQNNQSTTTSGFGQNNNTASTGGGLFGGSTGGFGQNNQQGQAQTQSSGGLFGGGFGQNNQQNQQKPGGLFGGTSTTTPASGGLFGQSTQNQPQQSGGLFGGSTANNTGGGLFGQKPATGGNSLFGGNTTNTNTASGGLFGNLGTQNAQQNTGGGLFGAQNNQQKTGGLFGSTSNTNTGGGLFGGGLGQQNTNNQSSLGGSLFSSQNQQQQNQQSNGNSLFGASGSSLLNTSMATNPYGNDALFAGLSTPTQSPGPLATPLSSSQKHKKSAILPQHKLNPSASTRLLTPQNKRIGGYGFTYSTYGTPASASSQSSPGFGGSLFASGSLSRSLGKSLSTSNLRNSYTPDTSILSPGAFSTSSRGFGNGSLKKLNINRSINTRIPLFDEPPQKRVSFAGGEASNGQTNGETALIVRQDEGASSPRTVDNDSGSNTPRAPQANSTEMARIAEDHALTPRSSSSLNAQASGADPKPGEYWSKPSLDELRSMSAQQLKSIPNFVVGRHEIGHINFNHGKPVDLSEVALDKMFGDIVQLNPRNATVYGESCTCLPKPPLGTALNQPSQIVLANSWPRNKHGKKDAKHLERLKRVEGTTFERYDHKTGEWTFTVPHFSSYGLDYDNDYSDDEDDESSELSDAPDTPAQVHPRSVQMTSTPQDDSFDSPTQSQSSPDDTFDFKKGMRSRASVPGGFGEESMYDDADEAEVAHGQSFLGQRSVGLLDQQEDDSFAESESELGPGQIMAESVTRPTRTTELAAAENVNKEFARPKPILKASQALRPGQGTPSKNQPIFDDDWANQLQRTISPKKQDRPALRESQGNVLREIDGPFNNNFSQSFGGQTLATAMDLMESLFGESEKDKASQRGGHGIELPYPKRPKLASDLDNLSEADKKFHGCSKPRFSESNILIYGNKGSASLEDETYPTAQEPLVGATKDVRFVKMPTFKNSVPETLTWQMRHTKILASDGVPSSKLLTEPAPIEFSDLARAVALDSKAGSQEQQAWQLLSLLYDDADGEDGVDKALHKKEQLSEFWKQLVWDDAQTHLQQADSPEERAIAHLSCNNIADACHSLLDGFDLRLATMVAQIGGDATMRQSMTTQIDEWRRLDVLSEMADAHRAIYELLSGNCAQSEGKLGAGRENKASTFSIAARFALDWRRAFGLRLWYGIMADEPIELAVAQFADAIRHGKESVLPVPWFIQEGVETGFRDPQAEHREDLLWGILKLYAAPKMDLPANVEDVLAPENVSGNPLDSRLSFQLFQFFMSRHQDQHEMEERKIAMPTVRGDGEDVHRRSFLSSITSAAEHDTQAEEPLTELGDKITLTYAASLHTPENWITAIWVYTHLSSAAMREHYIRSLLCQFTDRYTLDETDATYTRLTRELLVPVAWLHAAAALQSKVNGDALGQATHLILAHELHEAHEVLCHKVGPEAVISRDFDPLRELLGGFISTPSNSPTSYAGAARRGRRSEPVQGWAQGGQIYYDYIELLDLAGQRSAYRADDELNKHIHELLVKLQRSLEIVARDRLETCGLEERVALMEIAGTVANLITKNQHVNRSSILKLPLTENSWLKHSCELSTNYYRSVIASGR